MNNGNDFFEIINPGYFPKTGDKFYFETAGYITNPILADKIDDLMDKEGFTATFWDARYKAEGVTVSILITIPANLHV